MFEDWVDITIDIDGRQFSPRVITVGELIDLVMMQPSDKAPPLEHVKAMAEMVQAILIGPDGLPPTMDEVRKIEMPTARRLMRLVLAGPSQED
jgi:hypothetical protein